MMMDKEINCFITSRKEQENAKKALISYLKNLSFLHHVSHAHEEIPRSRLLSQPRSKSLCLEQNFICLHTFNRGPQPFEQNKQHRYTQQNVELVTFYCSIFIRKPESLYICILNTCSFFPIRCISVQDFSEIMTPFELYIPSFENTFSFRIGSCFKIL